MVGFLFTVVGIVGKTMLTVGMHETMHQFVDKDMDEYWSMVSNDKFLKDSLIRGILSTMFLVLGWSIIGLIAKSTIFSFTNFTQLFGTDLSSRKKKRRRRHAKDNELRDFATNNSINQLSFIERTIPLIITDHTGLNEYLIKRSLENVLQTLKKSS